MSPIDRAFQALARTRDRLPAHVAAQAHARLCEIGAGDRPRRNPIDTPGARLADRLVLALMNEKESIHDTSLPRH